MTQNSKKEALFSQVWTCVTSLTKTKILLPVGRMLSLGPWPRMLPKPYETMFNMHKNKRLLWGVHDQKRARRRTRKEQQCLSIASISNLGLILSKLPK